MLRLRSSQIAPAFLALAIKQKPRLRLGLCLLYVAEEEGFEPPDPVKGLRFSRPVQ
jgi:hypothetical protein